MFDVSQVWEQRMAATRAYGSQFYAEDIPSTPTKISSPGFMEAIEGRARHYGLMVGASFGEPIRWEHPPRVRQLSAFLEEDRS